MSEQNTSNDMTRVDTGAMRETSAMIRKRLETIKAAQEELKSCLKLMQDIWEGAASESYSLAYQKVFAGLSAAQLAYASLPDKLDRFADEHEQANGVALEVAQSIEKPVWADMTGLA